MPGLESTTLEVVANGGLAEDVNERVLQAGSWLALENVAIDKGGEFRKRNGYVEYKTYRQDGALIPYPVFSAPLHLGSHGSTLFSFLVQQGGPTPEAAKAAPALCVQNLFGEWVAKDDVSPFLVRRAVGLRSHREFAGGAIVYAANNRYSLGVLYNDDPAEPGGLPIVLRGEDRITGAVVQDDVVIGYLEPGLSWALGYTMKATNIGAFVVVVHNSSTGVALTVYDPSTRTFATTQIVASVTLGLTRPSLWAGDNNKVIVAWNDGSTLRVREWQIFGIGSVFPQVTNYSLVESGTIGEIEVCTDDNSESGGGASRVFVTYTVLAIEGAGETKTLALTRSTFALAWGPVVLDAEPWRYITNVHAGGYLWSVGNDQPTGHIDNGLIYVRQTATTGANLSEQKLAAWVAPSARPFVWKERAYLPTIARGSGGGGPPYTGAVVELKVTLVDGGETSEPAPLVGTFAVEEWGSFKLGGVFTCSKPAFNSSGFEFAAPVFTGVASTGLDAVELLPVGETWLVPTTQAQGLAVIPGALTSYFDGQGVFEAGFLEPPTILRATKEALMGGLAPGDYLWVAIWAYEDAAGNLHYSQPSDPFAYSVLEDGYQVNLEIATDRIGRRDRDIDGEERKVRLIVYRTKAGLASPFYRLMSPTIEDVASEGFYNGPCLNDRYVEKILFHDTTTDGQIGTRDYGLLPFDLSGNKAGVLDCDPPPPSRHALNHKNRLWLVSGDDPRMVWFSREFRKNEAPAFSRVLQFSISDTTEDITALAPLGDKVLIFTKSRIYFVAGDGPDDTGQGGLPFQGPFLVSDTIGCTDPKSVVPYEGGVVFLQATGRFVLEPYGASLYQISGAMQIARISGPVDDTLAAFNTVAGAWVDPARGWIGFGLRRGYYEDQDDPAVHLVWSFWRNVWVKWTTPNHRVSASHLHRGEHVWAGTNDWFGSGFQRGHAFTEARELYEDPQYINTAQWITMRLTTPWLRAGALAGYARTRQVQVLGETNPDYLFYLDVKLDYDQREDWSSTYRFEVASFTHRTFPLVHVSVIPGIQKSRAMRVTLSDAHWPETSFGPGLTLSAISLEIAGKKGLAKLAQSSRARGAV